MNEWATKCFPAGRLKLFVLPKNWLKMGKYIRRQHQLTDNSSYKIQEIRVPIA